MATLIYAINIMETDYLLDEVFGERLLISTKAVSINLRPYITRRLRSLMLSRLYATLIFLYKDSYFQLIDKFQTISFVPMPIASGFCFQYGVNH